MEEKKNHTEKRKFLRHPFGGQPCKVCMNGHSYDSEVLDYSEEGCKIAYLPHLQLGDEVEIVFVFEFGYLNFPAIIKWVNEELGIGAQFIKKNDSPLAP